MTQSCGPTSQNGSNISYIYIEIHVRGIAGVVHKLLIQDDLLAANALLDNAMRPNSSPVTEARGAMSVNTFLLDVVLDVSPKTWNCNYEIIDNL